MSSNVSTPLLEPASSQTLLPPSPSPLGGNTGSTSASKSKGGGGGNKKKGAKAAAASLRGGRGVIRAWTTKLRYRGRGIGGDMLHEAVRITREKCGKDAEVGFAKEHANSEMILPSMFNGRFRKGEMRAARALEKVLALREGGKRKK